MFFNIVHSNKKKQNIAEISLQNIYQNRRVLLRGEIAIKNQNKGYYFSRYLFTKTPNRKKTSI